MYEKLIERLRECSTYGFKQEICVEAADAIEQLSRDFAIIDDLNHDKDIEIEELQEVNILLKANAEHLKEELKQVLQEREARRKRCEYCMDDCCAPLDWKYGLDHILPDYKFCPMCGRELQLQTILLI